MKIRAHAESHLVELDDGSRWQIFPGDLVATLSWTPETELALHPGLDGVGTHVLLNEDDQSRVRVLRVGETWPDAEVRRALKDS